MVRIAIEPIAERYRHNVTNTINLKAQINFISASRTPRRLVVKKDKSKSKA